MRHTLLLSLALAVLCSRAVFSTELRLGAGFARHLLQSAGASPPPSAANLTAVVNGIAVNGTGTTAGNDTAVANSTSPSLPPPIPSNPPPPEDWKGKWKDNKSSAEKGIAIAIGVIMLVSIITCLVCCVFRRGGQWRIPGLQWFKKKFGPKDKYSRYSDSAADDDGF